MKHAKWVAKLGGWGYDFLILLNRLINFILLKMGRERYSLSKKIKNSVKSAVSFISNFEQTATDLAIENNFDYVICGHIHQPKIQEFKTNKGATLYLNSGDWIENLSALEYNNEAWRLYYWDETQRTENESLTPEEVEEDNDWSHILSAMTAYRRRLT